MLTTFTREELTAAGEHQVADALEAGSVVYFPECPFDLPVEADLEYLRSELPRQLKLKNVSYHPESDRLNGVSGNGDLHGCARRVLLEHSHRVERFLHRVIPGLAREWTVGTSSFRPIQEQNRNLTAHASNELVHIDAGAYGATNGNRILRFFVNVNPREDRVWVTKGVFPDLYRRYGKEAGVVPERRPARYLEKKPMDHLRTAVVKGLAGLGLPMALVLDSSPYDRTMRRFHNFMKDTPAFQQTRDGHQEFRFKPYSAWMVFTDMLSHASLSGQHALVNTMLIRQQACRHPELTPINVLKTA